MVDWRGGRRAPQEEGEAEPLERAIGALRALPPLDRDAVSRIVATAARAREHDTEPQVDDLPPARLRMIRWPAVATIAAAAAIVGFLAGSGKRQVVTQKATPEVPRTSAVAPALQQTLAPPAALPVAATSVDLTAVPTQFVFDARGAKHVSLVGDFNGWDERAIPLEREAGSSLWSVTVPLMPGRHVYAFLVDSVWTTDPRAPKSRDPDFGVTGSVVIVGVP